jgi:cytoskeletal protein RodZ
MNSEYLFSKEGSDVEIERMEDLLSIYRIEPVAPAFNRAVVADEHSTRPGFGFLLTYIGVIGTLAAIVIIVVTVITWQTGKPVEVTAVSPAVDISPVTTVGDSVPVYPNGGSTAVPPENSTSTARPSLIKTTYRQTARPASKFQRHIAAEPKLTAEEKYAYEQVKVALFLAGSKLKVVQDTIDRTDDSSKNSFTDKR